MRHIGLDVHQTQTTLVWMDDAMGEISRARCLPTREVARHVRALGDDLRIVMESGLHSKFLARQLISCGLDVWVLDARKVAAQMPAYKTGKTDRLDARALAMMSFENAIAKLRVWVPDERTEELRGLTRTREKLVQQTTALRNEWRAQLAAFGCVCPATDVLSPKARHWLTTVWEALPAWGQFCLQRIRDSLHALREQIRLLDREIARHAARDRACQVVRSVGGCGDLLAVTIVAELGDVKRFANLRRACSYAGLTPTVHQSGERCYTGRITKRGNPHLRRALTLLAQHFAWHKDLGHLPVKRRYYRTLHKHGANAAKVALARGLLRIIVAMLRADQPFAAAPAVAA
jgi:transposase